MPLRGATASAVTIPIKHAASSDDLSARTSPQILRRASVLRHRRSTACHRQLARVSAKGRQRFMMAVLGQAVPIVALWAPAAIGLSAQLSRSLPVLEMRTDASISATPIRSLRRNTPSPNAVLNGGI
jgi:hypothetical protein